ncbi:MAG: hypothetical protein Kow00129_10320 [Thermoleophilia bacterium]
MRGSVAGRLHPDGRQCLVDAHGDFFRRQTHVRRPESDVLGYRCEEELVVGILKHHAYAAPDLTKVCLLDRETENPHLAPALEYPVEVEKQCGLAGSVGAYDGERFPRLDPQVDAPKGMGPVRIDEVEITDFEGGGYRFGGVCPRMGRRAG